MEKTTILSKIEEKLAKIDPSDDIDKTVADNPHEDTVASNDDILYLSQDNDDKEKCVFVDKLCQYISKANIKEFPIINNNMYICIPDICDIKIEGTKIQIPNESCYIYLITLKKDYPSKGQVGLYQIRNSCLGSVSICRVHDMVSTMISEEEPNYKPNLIIKNK